MLEEEQGFHNDVILQPIAMKDVIIIITNYALK